MSDGIERSVLDLTDYDIHVVRIEAAGPVCYRIEHGDQKVTLTIQDAYTIFGGIRSNYECLLREMSFARRRGSRE